MKLAFSKGLNYIYTGSHDLRRGLANIFSLRFFLVAFIVGVLANIVAWIFTGSLNHSLSSGVAVLHYNVIFGIDKVGAATSLFIIPLFGFGLLLVNLILALIIGDKRQWLLVNSLMIFSAVGNLLLLLSLYFIYLINFS